MTAVTLTSEEWAIARAGIVQNIPNLAAAIVASTIAPIDAAIAAAPGEPVYTIDVDVSVTQFNCAWSWERGAKIIASKLD